jgi:hypothetical protein
LIEWWRSDDVTGDGVNYGDAIELIRPASWRGSGRLDGS